VRVPVLYDQHVCDLFIMAITFHGKLCHEDGNERMLLLRKTEKTGLNYLLICWQNRFTFLNEHPSKVLHRRKQSSLIICY
jgi:hypothetical protein